MQFCVFWSIRDSNASSTRSPIFFYLTLDFLPSKNPPLFPLCFAFLPSKWLFIGSSSISSWVNDFYKSIHRENATTNLVTSRLDVLGCIKLFKVFLFFFDKQRVYGKVLGSFYVFFEAYVILYIWCISMIQDLKVSHCWWLGSSLCFKFNR